MNLWNLITTKLWKWYKGHEGVTDAHHTKYTDAEAIMAVDNNVEGCAVERTAVFSVPSKSWTKLLFDNIFFNLNNGYSTGTYKYTAPKPGYYQINATVTITSLANDRFIIIWVKKNGTGISQARDYSGGGSYTNTNISAAAYLTTGDYIEIYVYHFDIVARNLKVGGGSTSMSIIRV